MGAGSLRVYFGVARNVLALLALILLLGSALAYRRAAERLRDFDPRATRAFAQFARATLERGAASASAITVPLADGVSMKAAVAAMKARAEHHGFALESLYRAPAVEAGAAGPASAKLEVFRACDDTGVDRLLALERTLAVQLPCRIALYADEAGRGWLATANLELLIHGGRDHDPRRKADAVDVADTILDIMAAGASGQIRDL